MDTLYDGLLLNGNLMKHIAKGKKIYIIKSTLILYSRMKK